MSYAGLYINLDRCPGRRAEIESELARHGLHERYRRHAATDGNALGFPAPGLNAGETGCFSSHYLALHENRGLDRHLHILEDDAVFAASTASVIDRIIATGEMEKFDILYTDIAIPLANEAYREFKALYDAVVAHDGNGAVKSAAFQILGLNRFMAPSASSYIVNGNAIDKISRMLGDELMGGAHLPVDAFLFKKIASGELKAGFVFPFLTSVRIERTMDSAVRKISDDTRRFTASNIARHSFFIGCDMDACRKGIEQFLPLPPDENHTRILADILAFSLIGGENQKAR